MALSDYCLLFLFIQIAGLGDELSSGQAQIEMLTHSLSEKDAQLKMEVNKREVCQEDLNLQKYAL